MGIVRQPRGHMAGDEVALILARQHTAGIDELSGKRLVHLIPF
jgi:hypothetical protein